MDQGPNSNHPLVKKAGPYFLGPKMGVSSVQSVTVNLARKEGTADYYTIKVLTTKDNSEVETTDDKQGKIFLYTESNILSFLKGEPGVVQAHGLFKEVVMEKREINGEVVLTGKSKTKVYLVLDCYTPREYCQKYTNLITLGCHVIRKDRLPETEAIQIFYKTVKIVERLHKKDVVHCDLKLGNIIMNKDTKDITIANFILAKHLTSENQLISDLRGSPAYLCPDALRGKPYLGKPCDMWALGISLYVMLYGAFPFNDKAIPELFKKIATGVYHLPAEYNISLNTVQLLKNLLVLDPAKRLTATQAIQVLRKIMTNEEAMKPSESLRVVPDCPVSTVKPIKRTYDQITGNQVMPDLEAPLEHDWE